ncbi:MAG: hypothetical protein ACJ77K_04485 [Bacteroidia bacterium]
MYRLFKITFLLLIPVSLFSQDNGDDGGITPLNKKGFQMGITLGSYFANKYTADAYDGWGYDLDAKRITDFEQSWMYQKIVNIYGGGFGYTDQVAMALNVNHSDWSFGLSDMPVNMHYRPAFVFGLNSRYSVDGKNAILINLNMSKIYSDGNFTIETIPPTGSTQINKSVRTYSIRGQEQRMFIQLGYNRVLGKGERVKPLLEGGLNMTYSQFDKDEIQIEALHIDLLEFYDRNGIQQGYVKKPRGWGLGAYAGVGLNFAMNDKFLVQIIYSPSYEGIAIGENQRLKIQNSLGLRAYYNFL